MEVLRMKTTSIMATAALATLGCVSAVGPDFLFSEWQAYELGETRPPPPAYRLDGNGENCLPRPLSECIYSVDGLSLGYHDGVLISKEAHLQGRMDSHPLIADLAAAAGREGVIRALKGASGINEPRCYGSQAGYTCGTLLKENHAEYLEAHFSSEWELISISFNVPDAL